MSESMLNEFAHKLYNKLGAHKDENVFISPFSISAALAMCYFGARNETASQLRDLLNFSKLPDSEILNLSSKYLDNINNLGDDVVISTASKILLAVGFDGKKEFLELIAKHFHSEIQEVNYSNQEKAAATINKWVAVQTRDKIKDLISPESLNPLNRLVLINAVYFKGNWMNKFDSKYTEKKEFHGIDGKITLVDMMHLSEKFVYFDNLEGIPASSCTLPYAGDKIAMSLILPHKGHTLDEIESKLVPSVLQTIYEFPYYPVEKISVRLPKFKLRYTVELSQHFKAMGVLLPFEQSSADFSGISSSGRIFISQIVHQAAVEVDESGTEATAATTIAMRTLSARLRPEPEFVCDRPFLFAIHERTFNTTLFIGKYVKSE